MSADLLPGGDRGSIIITEQQLAQLGLDGINRLNSVLKAEARRRGLQVRVTEDILTLHYVVEWKPDPTQQEVTE